MLASWVRQSTSTTGTGTITLDGTPASGFVGFSDAFSTGEVVNYTIEDGNNRETGIGTLTTGASWTLSRDVIHETLVSGTYSKMPATGISLSGSAVVSVSANASTSQIGTQVLQTRYGSSSNWTNLLRVTEIGSGSTQTPAERTYAVPFTVDTLVEITNHAIEIVTADGAATSSAIGIYDADENENPNNLLGSGSIDVTTTGVKSVTYSPALVLTPGKYFAAVVSDGSPYWRSVAGIATDGITSASSKLSAAKASTPTLPDPFGTPSQSITAFLHLFR